MADVGASLHEEGLPDWMSQLFEKLDLEVYEDSISTGEMAQVGTYHIAEEKIRPWMWMACMKKIRHQIGSHCCLASQAWKQMRIVFVPQGKWLK